MTDSAAFISSSSRDRVDHDVFISYSRRDSEFARQLLTRLKGENRDAWVDWQSIEAAEDFWQAIEIGIEAANTFVFILSPDSAISKYCNQEIDHAVKHNKRLIPVVCRDVDATIVHAALRSLNWIFFQETTDDEAFAQLVRAIDTDLPYVRMHTRLQVKAIEWNKRGRDDSFLLRKHDLSDAETWLTGSNGKEPAPTALQQDYITTSRTVEDEYNQLLAKGERALGQVKLAAIVVPIAVAIASLAGVFAVIATRDLQQKQQDIQDVWRFSEAEVQLAQGNYGRALETINEVIQKNPHNTFALLSRGWTYRLIKNYQTAEADFRHALQLDPHNANAYNNLGLVLIDQNKLTEAVATLHKAIELNPKFASGYNNLGLALYNQKKLDEAIRYYREAIELDPASAPNYYNLGLVLNDQNKLEEAIFNYHKAIELDSKYAVAYNSLGSALYDQRKLDEATTAYRKAIKLDPRYAYAYNNLGLALYDQRKLDKAIAAYHKAIELDPKYALAYNYLGYVLKAQGKMDEAIAAIAQAISLEPKNANYQDSMGEMLMVQGNHAQAIKFYEQALSLDSNVAETYAKRGKTYYFLKRYSEALKDLDRAIELGYKEEWALQLREQVKTRMRDGG